MTPKKHQNFEFVDMSNAKSGNSSSAETRDSHKYLGIEVKPEFGIF